MKQTIFFASALMVLASAAPQTPAQWTPPAPAVALRSTPELDQLLAPIALYPDPLVAQILPAATQPGEIVLAARYVFGGGDMNQLDLQPWSLSLKAVARYPDVLRMMDQRLDWTAQLGQAFIFQQADVMNAIQRLRFQAQTLGNLQTTPQHCVVVNSGVIEILPARAGVIYVPVYQPEFIFARSGFFLSFGNGFSIGFWLNHDCDWRHHNIFAWHRDHYRPHDWWFRPPRDRVVPVAVNNHITIVNRDVTVWRPHSRAPITTVNRVERRGEIRDIRPATAVTIQPVTRPPEPRRETERAVRRPTPAPEKHSRGNEAVRDARPNSGPGQPRRETTIQPASPPRPAVPAPSVREPRPNSGPSQPKREAAIQPAMPVRPVAPAPAPSSRELRPGSGPSQSRREVTIQPLPRLPSASPAPSRELRSNSSPSQPRREMTAHPTVRPPSAAPVPAVRRPAPSEQTVPTASPRESDSSDNRGRRPRSRD